MIPATELIEKLQLDLTRKAYSFTEYITVSSPYIARGKEPLWAALLTQRNQEQKHAEILARLIVSLGGVPNPGLFDESVADMSYLSIVYLYGQLIQSKKRSTSAFEERLGQCKGFPEGEAVINQILDEERQQLEQLEQLLSTCA